MAMGWHTTTQHRTQREVSRDRYEKIKQGRQDNERLSSFSDAMRRSMPCHQSLCRIALPALYRVLYANLNPFDERLEQHKL